MKVRQLTTIAVLALWLGAAGAQSGEQEARQIQLEQGPGLPVPDDRGAGQLRPESLLRRIQDGDIT